VRKAVRHRVGERPDEEQLAACPELLESGVVGGEVDRRQLAGGWPTVLDAFGRRAAEAA
jgi:hypothetical protein